MIRVIGFDSSVTLKEVTCNSCHAINEFDPKRDMVSAEPFGSTNRHSMIRCGNCHQYVSTDKNRLVG
jgi:nitrate/TMAO reductase-like tetraheme cytochrome c subunit